MPYTITKTNGQTLVSIDDGNADTSYSSLTLFGRNYADYGLAQNINFVKLLENFSHTSAPSNPIQGQLWWDSNNKQLKVRTTVEWKNVGGGALASAASPDNSNIGDLWWNTDKGQLFTFDGTDWNLIGPAYSKTQSISGPITASVVDSEGLTKNIVLLYVSGQLIGILSDSPTFTINTLAGFSIINPGLTIASGRQINVSGKVGANLVSATTLEASSAILPVQANTVDLGSSELPFRTMYGTSTTALYADVAENFVADAYYEPGTVLDFGGQFEVTLSIVPGSHRVAGVVSTDPAYLMNSMCLGDYVTSIALDGRCPVKVDGPVNKGDLLVSAGNGRAIVNNCPLPGTIIGKAIESCPEGHFVIEASVFKG